MHTAYAALTDTARAIKCTQRPHAGRFINICAQVPVLDTHFPHVPGTLRPPCQASPQAGAWPTVAENMALYRKLLVRVGSCWVPVCSVRFLEIVACLCCQTHLCCRCLWAREREAAVARMGSHILLFLPCLLAVCVVCVGCVVSAFSRSQRTHRNVWGLHPRPYH